MKRISGDKHDEYINACCKHAKTCRNMQKMCKCTNALKKHAQLNVQYRNNNHNNKKNVCDFRQTTLNNTIEPTLYKVRNVINVQV